MSSPARLLSREVLPFLASFAALNLVALAADGLLHLFDLLWVGRWLGIPGTLLIIGSTVYSLRKRKVIRLSQPARLLRWTRHSPGRARCWCWCMRGCTSTRSWAGSRCGRCWSTWAAA